MIASDRPRTEREPQKRKPRVRKRSTPIVVLAVHDLGLVRMQAQPELLKPRIERGPHMPSLPLGHSVHHCIIGVAFELHSRKFSSQERVERILQEQVGQ